MKSGETVLGGVLLGLGAFINGACVFGAIALFGSGRWAQLFMPAGFYLGCVSLTHVFLDETDSSVEART